MSEIDTILKNSTKAELLETLGQLLSEYDKAVIVLAQDHADGSLAVQTLVFGIPTFYEACGLMDVAQHDMLHHEEGSIR